MANWHVSGGGRQEGPVPESRIAVDLRSGLLSAKALVRGEGMADWKPVSQVPELARHLPTAAGAGDHPKAGTGGGHTLREFLQQTAERDRPGEVFELESSHMLEIQVNGRVWSKLGAMVAYRGELRFVREGAFEHGIGHFMKKTLSGEAAPLSKIEGRGVVYLADLKKSITLLRLEGEESLCVNGNDLLAFEAAVRHEITMHRRIAGMLAGGLFSVRLSGHGLIAIVSHGKPLTLACSAADPVVTDPNATVAWSGNLSPEFKTDISLRSFLGRGGGEAFQMRFAGDGFVVVQPYEEKPVAQAQRR